MYHNIYLPDAEMNSYAYGYGYGPCCKLCGDGTFWKNDMYSNFNILGKVTKLLSLVNIITFSCCLATVQNVDTFDSCNETVDT